VHSVFSAQTKAIQAFTRNLPAMNLASQHPRDASNASSLKMAKELYDFVERGDLLNTNGIDGFIDVEISATFLGHALGITAGGLMATIKEKVDNFVSEERVFLPIRTSREHMLGTARAVLSFVLKARLYERSPRKPTDESLRSPLVITLSSLGLSAGNHFRKFVREPVYHAALSSSGFFGLNLFRWCGIPGHNHRVGP
jgi:hypothetical protein